MDEKNMSSDYEISETKNYEDIEEIERFEKKVFKKTGGLTRGILFPVANFLGFILVAKKDEIMGHTVFFQTKKKDEMYCASLAVLKKYRKKGIATNLIRKSEEKCKKNEKKFLIATGSPTNLGSCKVFLNNQGWHAVHLYKGFYRKNIDSFLFKKNLYGKIEYSDEKIVNLESTDEIISLFKENYHGTRIIDDEKILMKKTCG